MEVINRKTVKKDVANVRRREDAKHGDTVHSRIENIADTCVKKGSYFITHKALTSKVISWVIDKVYLMHSLSSNQSC